MTTNQIIGLILLALPLGISLFFMDKRLAKEVLICVGGGVGVTIWLISIVYLLIH